MGRMPRLAWFTPLPSGSADWAALSLEVLPRLATEHQLAVFSTDPIPAAVAGRAYPATSFEARHQATPFDLVVYELADARRYEWLWPWLDRRPGLVILHDLHFHRSRVAALVPGQLDAYRAEFAFDHPDAPAGIPDMVALGLGDGQTRMWPMLRSAVARARFVAVHNRHAASRLATEYAVPVDTVRLGTAGAAGMERDQARQALSIPVDAVLFASLGRLGENRRVREALLAFRTVARSGLPVHLLLAGETDPDLDVTLEAEALGIRDRLTVVLQPDASATARALAAADVVLALGWPPSGEAALAAIEAMAAGKATIVTTLGDEDEVASLDPRTSRVSPSGLYPVGDPGRSAPACVSIDLVDEGESLRVAFRRLAVDPALRDQVGRQGQRHWQREHTLDAMVDDYRRVIAAALER